MKKRFIVGDIVKGIGEERDYGVTNRHMYSAEITHVDTNGRITVLISDHKHKENIGEMCGSLQPEYFEKIETEVKFKIVTK